MNIYNLECYDDITEELISEFPLPTVTVEFLREIFGTDSEEYFVDAWELNQGIAKRLAPYLEKPLRFDGCTWFLTMRAIPHEQAP